MVPVQSLLVLVSLELYVLVLSKHTFCNVIFLSILVFEEFQGLLSKQAPIEAYTEWMDNVIDKCVLQVRVLYNQVSIRDL